MSQNINSDFRDMYLNRIQTIYSETPTCSNCDAGVVLIKAYMIDLTHYCIIRNML